MTGTPHDTKARLSLTPAQESAFGQLVDAVRAFPLVLLEGDAGSGKTTLVERLIRECGGGLRLDGRQIIAETSEGTHTGTEEPLLRLLEDSLAANDLLVLEDVESLEAESAHRAYARRGSLPALLRMLFSHTLDAGKTLVLTRTPSRNFPILAGTDIAQRVLTVRIPPLEVDDYAFLLRQELSDDRVDASSLFEHSPGLGVIQLLHLARLARSADQFDARSVRDIVDTRITHANTRTEEIADISLDDLKGFGHIAEALTTFVLNPLRSDVRVKGLGLRPKRGVLLYGPPGTGKTSVGRALAHQMRGRFFMIDGSIAPEPAVAFYTRVRQIVLLAKRSAPCVLFIDDADVLMQSGYSPGFTRYFLSLMDGMESETAGKIAIILTAMNPNHIPPALLRSGRVELWLQTTPPPASARTEMLAAHVATLPDELRRFDSVKLDSLTDGFNAADMRRIAADVKALYARDVIEGRAIAPADTYFERATRNVRRNRELLRLAEAGQLV